LTEERKFEHFEKFISMLWKMNTMYMH
jgi:hypothetical protein